MAEVREPINLLLSREELLFVLNLLQIQAIPGLELDPEGELSSDQQALVLRVAERALRARQLAWIRHDQQIALHNNLLAAVLACVYAAKGIFVYHWGPNQTLPTAYFGHIRGKDIVVHSRPADVLHLFSLLATPTQFVQQLLTACAYTETPVNGQVEMRVPSATFAQVRTLASAGAIQPAVDMLVRQAVAREPATALVNTLTAGLRASNVQLLKQANGQMQRQDYVLLQNQKHTWLATNPGDEAAPMTVKPITRAGIETLLSQWLA